MGKWLEQKYKPMPIPVITRIVQIIGITKTIK